MAISMVVFYVAYIVFPFLIMLGAIGLAFYAGRRPHIRGAIALTHLLFAYALTIFFALAASLTPVPSLVEIWSNFLLLSSMAASILSLRFILHTTGRRHWITPTRTALVLILPILLQLLIWTNNFHHLLKRDWELLTIGGLTFERATAGPGYQLHVLLLLAFSLTGIGILLLDLASKNHLFRWKLTGLLLGSLFQRIFGIYISYLFGALMFLPNLVSLIFLPGIVLYSWALFRHSSYNATITYDDIIDSLYEVLIVIDLNEAIIQFNLAAARWLNQPAEALQGEVLWPLLAQVLSPETRHSLRAQLSHQQTVIQEVPTLQDETFNLRLVPLYDQADLLGYMLIGRDVTTRHRLQEAQAENDRALEIVRNRYRELVEHVPGMVYEIVLSHDHQQVYYNYVSNASREMGGMTLEEVRLNPMAFVGRIIPADFEGFFQKMKDSARDLTPFHTVARVNFNGQIRWHEFYSSPTRLAEATMWHGIELDVTERYLIQEALQQNEEMMRSIIRSLDDLVFALDTDGNFVGYYQAADDSNLMFSPEEFIGRSYKEILPPAVRAQLREALQRAAAENRVQTFEYMLPLDNEPYWFRAKISARYDGQNVLTGYTGVVTNIQQQKESLQQLADSERKIRAAIDNSPVAMVVMDWEENILLVNSQFTKLFGYTLEDLPHVDNWFQQAYPDKAQRQLAREQWQVRVDQMMLGKTFQSDRSTELVINCQDGSERIVLITGEVAADQFIIILQDMTEQRRIEAELKAAKEAAEEANRAKSRFLANMSHELRTPLNAILGFTELLTMSELSPVNQERAQTVHNNGRHLLTLINDVLELSKIEAGRSTAYKGAFAIQPLLREAHQLFEVRAQEKRLTYTIYIDPQLPKTVISDELKTRQILLNLLSNAIKFTDEGSVDLSAVWQSETQMVRLIVKDTGLGIAPHEQPQLFEPFSQTENGYRKKGTGLGLALVNEYAKLMGGSVMVESYLNEGSTFEVTFPVEVAATSEPVPADENRHIKKATFPDERKPRILIVDDAQTNLLFVQAWLKQIDMEVATASNGREALDTVPHFEPDLILMDISMPVMNGHEAAAALRESGFNRPIIAFTATTFSEKEPFLASEFDDLLYKPFDTEALLNCLLQHLPLKVEHVSQTATPTLPEQIPAELRGLVHDLRQAVLQLNLQKTQQLISKIEPFDAPLAQQLRKLTLTYQLDKIAAWIDTLPS